ncbi:MAG: hypothetical protein JWR90_464 [Marmoricola sp.]|jgi:hypothetical protein|nr:hypothetical protein [Marmoricola sp.]
MKFLGSLIATMALALGALVAVPSTATAAPYPGTVATRVTYAAPGAVKRKRNFNVAVNVRASGNARPAGTVTFRVYKVGKNGGLSFNRSVSIRYTGPYGRRVSLGKFQKKGTFVTNATFYAANGSVYKDSFSGNQSFRVKR